MAERDPLLPNAGIVARREYRDRVRSPLFIGSTIVLMGLAMLVALAPIAIRYLDRQTVTNLAVVSDDAGPGAARGGGRRQLLNIPPAGADPAAWEKPFRVELIADRAAAESAMAGGHLAGIMVVQRLPNGQVDVAFRTNEGINGERSQLLSIAAFGIGVLDWSSRLPGGDARPSRSSRPPTTSNRPTPPARAAGRSTRRRPPAAACSGSSSSCSCSSRSSSTGCGSRPAWRRRRAAGSWS